MINVYPNKYLIRFIDFKNNVQEEEMSGLIKEEAINRLRLYNNEVKEIISVRNINPSVKFSELFH